jgi:hypothetical protein
MRGAIDPQLEETLGRIGHLRRIPHVITSRVSETHSCGR